MGLADSMVVMTHVMAGATHYMYAVFLYEACGKDRGRSFWTDFQGWVGYSPTRNGTAAVLNRVAIELISDPALPRSFETVSRGLYPLRCGRQQSIEP